MAITKSAARVQKFFDDYDASEFGFIYMAEVETVHMCNGARTRGLWSGLQGALVVYDYGFMKERMY